MFWQEKVWELDQNDTDLDFNRVSFGRKLFKEDCGEIPTIFNLETKVDERDCDQKLQKRAQRDWESNFWL